MGADSTRHPGMFKAARAKYAKLIGPLTHIAREHGYALETHGSLARDIDLIAVPWIAKPWNAEELVAAFIATCLEYNGCASLSPGDKNPELRPHGRRCWSIHLGGGVYIDLAIMPTVAEKDSHEPA